MRSLLLATIVGLIVIGAAVATRTGLPRITGAPASAAAADASVPADLGKSNRAYLMANPEVLVEAMQELERKQDTQRDAVAGKAISQNEAELFRECRQPRGRQSRG